MRIQKLLAIYAFILNTDDVSSSVSSETKIIHSAAQRNHFESSLPKKKSLTSFVQTKKLKQYKETNNRKSSFVYSRGGSKKIAPCISQSPSMYWAVLHNWFYFLSLGMNAVNVPFMIRGIVDGENAKIPSPKAIALSGKVESVDKILTFAGVGFLSALSDKLGRKPLMAWSAIGFMITNLIQANSKSSISALYLADFIDGCSSCMLPICQAYVTDCSTPSNMAANLGIFQGISAAGAFIIAFPVGGVLGARYGPRVPLLIAAGIQALNAIIILTVTPESNSPDVNRKIDLRKANPISNLARLFYRAPLLRIASILYLLNSLARGSLDAQFINYTSIRFGWSQAQSGPLLVLVGLFLAVVPQILVPRLGLKNSILSGLLIFALGLSGSALASTPGLFVASILVVSVGCVASPAITALLANLAPPDERGAILGAIGSLTELTGAISSTLYASILAKFTSDQAPLPIPGMQFLVGSMFLLIAFGIAVPGLMTYKDDGALETAPDYSTGAAILDL